MLHTCFMWAREVWSSIFEGARRLLRMNVTCVHAQTSGNHNARRGRKQTEKRKTPESKCGSRQEDATADYTGAPNGLLTSALKTHTKTKPYQLLHLLQLFLTGRVLSELGAHHPDVAGEGGGTNLHREGALRHGARGPDGDGGW